METESVSIYGQCRCCSATGSHKDLNEEYCWNGIREVYSDIIFECFNLSLKSQTKLSTLICSECINRLRDASSFKILIVNTERQLLEAHSQNNLNSNLGNIKNEFDYSIIVKAETTTVSCSDWPDDCYVENSIFQDDISLPSDDVADSGVKVIERLASLKQLSARSIKPLPTRNTLKDICENFVKHLDELKDKKITGKSLEIMLQKDIRRTRNTKRFVKMSGASDKLDNVNGSALLNKKKRIQRTKYRVKEEVDIDKVKNPFEVERLTHATNISVLLQFSNLTAFKSKFQRAYPCFYCEKLFEDFEELKKHQKLEHTKENVSKCVLQKYRVGKPDGVVAYADVSDLECTICNKTVITLNDLKKHLTEVHKKKMYLELSDRVIPFKVIENNFQCQICGNLYETFGAIERHMNTHYRNYVCEECDSGFVTKQRLRIHGYLMHSRRSRQYPCEICQKQFTSQQKRKIHVETVHENVKKYKCNRCDERFNEYFRRHKHMVLVHGVAPIEYKCNVCDKSFERRYGLSTHMRTHIQQKDIYCDLCPYRCFTNAQLRRHMIKHNGERIHECSVCKKSYAREKTLKEHMRIHTNDRRFVCPVCGQAFIQNCSLKSHVRSHHKEIV